MPINWRCPLCHEALHLQARTYRCSNGHSFDQAKEAYVNLLPVNRKKSADPGDNKAMLQSRREFLQRGFYEPLARALSQVVQKHAANEAQNNALSVLDAGCGEGYYLEQLAANLPQDTHFLGTDIARDAARMAAKRYPSMQCAVASSFDLPLPDASVDVVLRVFAPASEQEIARVLKPGGLFLWVHPGAQHLFELRALIYDQPQVHSNSVAWPDSLTLIEQQAVRYDLHLADNAAVSALLAMTPYYWAANEAKQTYCQSLQVLDLTVDFCITALIKR